MLPSSIVIPPPVPDVSLASLVGPALPLAIGVAAAALGAVLVGLLLHRIGTVARAGGRRGARTPASAPAGVRAA